MQVPQEITFANWNIPSDDQNLYLGRPYFTGNVIGNGVPYILNLTEPVYVGFSNNACIAECDISGLGNINNYKPITEIASKITYEFIPEPAINAIDKEFSRAEPLSVDHLAFVLAHNGEGSYEGTVKIYYDGNLLLQVNNLNWNVTDYEY